MRTKKQTEKRVEIVKGKFIQISKDKTVSKPIKALQEIKKYQETFELLANKGKFKIYCKTIIREFGDYRASQEAIIALQTAAEDYLVVRFSKLNKIAKNSNRGTILEKDSVCLKAIENE